MLEEIKVFIRYTSIALHHYETSNSEHTYNLAHSYTCFAV